MTIMAKKNPVIYSDFPDPDIIRVEDTYYMASTTMHFMPGCDILRSYDLMNWELIAHTYDELDDTPEQHLQGEQNIYGQGMWAPSLRYHKGTFYICFIANDTGKTYLCTATRPEGPWKKQYVDGFYYDCSLFFDDDDRVYIIHGNTEIHLTELNSDLTGPKPGGINRIIAKDEERICLGFEGSHLYKRNGKYYAFFCHWLTYGSQRKSQVCYVADSLEGEFKGGCILDDDLSYHNLGVAQGGMVDTPDGQWYAFMFHDRGALGRAPVMLPMHFENDFPVLGVEGKTPFTVSIPSTRPEYVYEPLNGDDDFNYEPDENGNVKLKLFWQFNHIPVNNLWSVIERKVAFRLHSNKICTNLVQANNTLTQRTLGPESAGIITVDGTRLKDGDYAGISAFLGSYGLIALTKEADQYYLVMLGNPAKDESLYGDKNNTEPAVEYARIPVASPVVTLKVHTIFEDKKDEASFYYKEGSEWKQLGIVQKIYFKMDHFCGCRFGLFLFSRKETGGIADFMNFKYQYNSEI